MNHATLNSLVDSQFSQLSSNSVNKRLIMGGAFHLFTAPTFLGIAKDTALVAIINDRIAQEEIKKYQRFFKTLIELFIS